MFTEIACFNKTGLSFTDLYFVRLKKGPVIAFFDKALEEGESLYWEKETSEIHIHSEGAQRKQYT